MDILAPAGNYQKFIAGLLAGADGFYLGLQKFSARSSAGNFSPAELQKVFLAAGLYHKKIYLAINTLLNENELTELRQTLAKIAPYRPAGIIIQDLALVGIIKSEYPELPLVASTQLTVHNLAGARFLERLGFDQAVLSRELSLEEIAYIRQNSKIKLEIFIHGAICFSYSGQCLFSSFIGGRSGNRGECAQICRKKFTLDGGPAGSILSPADLDGSAAMDKLAQLEITTLKIEGRMRSPQYAYAAVSYYRSLRDGLAKEEQLRRRLALNIAFDRGSSSGYFFGKNDQLVNPAITSNRGLRLGTVLSSEAGQVIIGRESPYQLQAGDGVAVSVGSRSFGFLLTKSPLNQADTILIAEQQNQFKPGSTVFVTAQGTLDYLENPEPKIPLPVKISCLNSKLQVELLPAKVSFELPLENARTEQNFAQLLEKKIANFTHPVFQLLAQEISVDNSLFLPYALLRTELNRQLDELATSAIPAAGAQSAAVNPVPKCGARREAILPRAVFIVENQEQLALCRQAGGLICLTYEFYLQEKPELPAGEKWRVLLPPLLKDRNYAALDQLPDNLMPVVSNPGEAGYFGKSKVPYATSWHLNTTNSGAAALLFEQGAVECMLSLESDLAGFEFAAGRDYSLLAYGSFPVMTTEYCLVKNNRGCHECQKEHYLIDEKGAEYRLLTNSFCQNQIFYHTPLNLGSDYQRLIKYPLRFWYINLCGLKGESARAVVNSFKNPEQTEWKTLPKQPSFGGRYRI